MPANKKHHYVPKFYLKRFSSDGKRINIFNIPSLRIIENANLKNECYEDFFYGKDLKIEKALSVLEEKMAEVLRKISSSNALPPFPSPHYIILLINVILQDARTNFTADQIDEMIDKNMKYILSKQNETAREYLNKVKIGLKNPGRLAVIMAARYHQLAMDLECKLIVNYSDNDFIASDNPVVFYNQFLEYRTFSSNTGIVSKGLEIFYPIDSKHALFFYDSNVYYAGRKRDKVIRLKRERDINELNVLQMVNADSNIYFHANHPDFNELSRLSVKYRRNQKSRFNVFENKEKPEVKSEFLASSKEDVRTELNLTFIRIIWKAKRWRSKLKKQKEQPAVVIRNMLLYEKYLNFWN